MGENGSVAVAAGDRGIAFGSRAARWAARLAFDAPVVFCEPAFALAALGGGLELRRAGRPFYVSIDLEDPRRTAFREEIRQRVPSVRSIDELRLSLDQAPTIAGPAVRPEELGPLEALIRLSHGVLVRSWSELERLRLAFGTLPRDAELVVAPEPIDLGNDDVPRTDIVVWGPYETSESLAPFVTALQDVALPMTLVAGDGPATIDRLRIVRPDEGFAALRRARVIIDATGNDPAVAIALAALGRPLCVAADGGAIEFVAGASTYSYWNRRSILAACSDALAADAPRVRGAIPAPATRAFPPAPTRTGSEKLVSIVIATRNRPKMLEATLSTIDRQTYPAVEVIVVNDAGTDISEIVAAHTRARSLSTPIRFGPAGARNAGLREARGEYVMFFDDDDEMFPDHVAVLADALDRTKLDVAYGQMLNGFYLKAGPDSYVLDGIGTHDALLDHADIQWAGAMATTSVLFRRRLIEEIGELDGGLVTAEDYDYWYRLAQDREWARVPYVTALYRWRLDGSNHSALSCDRFAVAHRQIYLKHPTNRTLVLAGRNALIDGLTDSATRERLRGAKNTARFG